MKSQLIQRAIMLALVLPFLASTAWALEEDWTVYPDPFSDAQCGVVNAWNAELLVIFESGTMVVVSGADVVLEDLFVSGSPDNEVFYLDEPFGFLQYAEDGDELPTLFWTTLTGTVVGIDTFTGEPFDSGSLPEERFATFCDGCDLVDTSPFCEDVPGGSDLGGGNLGGDLNIDVGELIQFCGAGATDSTATTAILLPVVGVFVRRRTKRHRK